MKIKIKADDIFACAIVAFPICNLIKGGFSYYDELIGVFSIAYIFFLIARGRIERSSVKICIILGVITFIGFISNAASSLTNNLFAISIDALWLWKPFVSYIAFFNIARNQHRRERIIHTLRIFAQICIWLTFVTSIAGQFVDIGVTGSKYVFAGIKTYVFFWYNGIQTGWLLFCCILIMAAADISRRKFYKYFILALVPLILTTSSLVYCWIVVEVALLLMLRENRKFKKRYLIILALIVSYFTSADIVRYFNEESVRMTLIIYGIVTANNYFPLGSGFATYGSEMASRYYSKLYIKYGWENTWTLGRKGEYLNDNFFAGIVGQFGWIGFALYLSGLYLLFKNVNSCRLNKYERVTSIATVITICVVMIGSASAKSMMGVCTFAMLGIISGKICSTDCSPMEISDENFGQI